VLRVKPYLNNSYKFSKYQNRANEICKEFQKRGFVCLWVGGAVRDLLLKEINFDIDLATNATPPEIKKVLSIFEYKIYVVGEKFGTIGVITPDGNIEITTFRKELGYTDQRHPDQIVFAQTAKEDSQRRDFTINGLYFDPLNNLVSDFSSGRRDLIGKQIRFIGKPEDRIKEDPLRMLRAVRFAANLNFKLEKKDLATIQKYSKEIKVVSGQRIKIELDKMFLAENFVQGVLLLEKAKLLKAIFPEVDNLKKIKQSKDYHAEGNVYNHVMNALRVSQKNLKDYNLTLRYAIFFHDMGKAFTGKEGERKGRDHISFHGHALKSCQLFNQVSKRVPFPRQQQKEIGWLLKHHMDMLNTSEATEKTLLKWALNERTEDLIKLRIADSLGAAMTDGMGKIIPKDVSHLKAMTIKWRKLNVLSKINLITGDDVMKELKIKPGTEVGYILRKIKQEQIFGRVKNKKEALKFLQNFTANKKY
jgi:tRNA nucleotidyltransferase (CCA-adding enzyme)